LSTTISTEDYWQLHSLIIDEGTIVHHSGMGGAYELACKMLVCGAVDDVAIDLTVAIISIVCNDKYFPSNRQGFEGKMWRFRLTVTAKADRR